MLVSHSNLGKILWCKKIRGDFPPPIPSCHSPCLFGEKDPLQSHHQANSLDFLIGFSMVLPSLAVQPL